MRRLRLVFSVAVLFLAVLTPSDRTVSFATATPTTKNDPRQILAIVVNPSNPVENLSLVELRKIFLGERIRWPNGHRVIVAMLDSGFPERDAALREVYRMTESGYRDHFLKGRYTGDIPVLPKTLSSPEILRRFIFNAPGAIGYLRASDVNSSVKVVSIDGRLPDNREYALLIEEPAK
jgi:ABC-type phosphate transport system substrate-binding protein